MIFCHICPGREAQLDDVKFIQIKLTFIPLQSLLRVLVFQISHNSVPSLHLLNFSCDRISLVSGDTGGGGATWTVAGQHLQQHVHSVQAREFRYLSVMSDGSTPGSEQKDKVVNTGSCNQAGFGLGLRDQRSSDVQREIGVS